jgi:hypothetical protein
MDREIVRSAGAEAVVAWGIGPFENDDAWELLSVLVVTTGTGIVAVALDAASALPEGEQLEAPEAAMAVAAAEVVATALGRPGPGVPGEVRDWIAGNHHGLDTALTVPMAREAIARVERPGSELRARWERDGRDSHWLAGLRDLDTRLSAGV